MINLPTVCLRPVVVVSVICLAASTSSASDLASFAAAVKSITASDLQTHVDVLADDTFEGREAGSRGGRAAGMYLLRQFERSGLQRAGDDGGFFQAFGSGYRNVLGLLVGRDPELKSEVIVVGAHYDHVGYGTRKNSHGPYGYVHNGADDNASGTAGLLEVVEAFRTLAEPPRRSVLFALWDGEEKGLLGSKHWIANPTVSLDKVMFAINTDMIGRMQDKRLEVYGTRTGQGLRRLIAGHNQMDALQLDFTWELKSNSDHYPFFASGIPVLMFHTGLHDDYHRPSDDAHLVNTEGMQSAARLLFHVAYDLAERPRLIGFRAASRQESPQAHQQLEQPLAKLPARLGVQWNQDQTERGIVLTRVTAGSAAARAGLRAGDRLTHLGGSAVTDSDRFRVMVLAATSPVSIIVEREGEQQPLTSNIELDGKPTRIGISWRKDDAEPGTAVVTRVVSGSAARQAGLRIKDRIYDVGGQRFRGSDELYDLLTGLPGPLEMTVERQGQLQSLTLDLAPQRTAVVGAE